MSTKQCCVLIIAIDMNSSSNSYTMLTLTVAVTLAVKKTLCLSSPSTFLTFFHMKGLKSLLLMSWLYFINWRVRINVPIVSLSALFVCSRHGIFVSGTSTNNDCPPRGSKKARQKDIHYDTSSFPSARSSQTHAVAVAAATLCLRNCRSLVYAENSSWKLFLESKKQQLSSDEGFLETRRWHSIGNTTAERQHE